MIIGTVTLVDHRDIEIIGSAQGRGTGEEVKPGERGDMTGERTERIRRIARRGGSKEGTHAHDMQERTGAGHTEASGGWKVWSTAEA